MYICRIDVYFNSSEWNTNFLLLWKLTEQNECMNDSNRSSSSISYLPLETIERWRRSKWNCSTDMNIFSAIIMYCLAMPYLSFRHHLLRTPALHPYLLPWLYDILFFSFYRMHTLTLIHSSLFFDITIITSRQITQKNSSFPFSFYIFFIRYLLFLTHCCCYLLDTFKCRIYFENEDSLSFVLCCFCKRCCCVFDDVNAIVMHFVKMRE